jgi:hypothetical protein
MNWWAHLSCSNAMAIITGVILGLAIAVTAIIKDVRRDRKKNTLARLNSPFFRNVYDPYYRAANFK